MLYVCTSLYDDMTRSVASANDKRRLLAVVKACVLRLTASLSASTSPSANQTVTAHRITSQISKEQRKEKCTFLTKDTLTQGM